jgi:hypothetical protein
MQKQKQQQQCQPRDLDAHHPQHAQPAVTNWKEKEEQEEEQGASASFCMQVTLQPSARSAAASLQSQGDIKEEQQQHCQPRLP